MKRSARQGASSDEEGWGGGYGFNWTTGGNAQKLAFAASTDAMIPICADQFLAPGPDAQAEYASTKGHCLPALPTPTGYRIARPSSRM